MSVLFPKVNKPREWDYRPIYYDPEKEERKKKLEALRAAQKEKEKSAMTSEEKKESVSQTSEKEPYVPTLHRGSFREARDAQGPLPHDRLRKTSRLTFWVALLALLAVVFYVCSRLAL